MALSCANILLDFRREAGSSSAIFNGGVLVFASTLDYAFFYAGTGHMIQRLGATYFTALTMIVAGLACIAQFLAIRPLRALAPPAAVHIPARAMVLLSTSVPAFLLSAGIRRIGPKHPALGGFFGSDFNNPYWHGFSWASPRLQADSPEPAWCLPECCSCARQTPISPTCAESTLRQRQINDLGKKSALHFV